MRIGLLAISGWLVAAALTVGISWSAISVVRDSVVTGSPTVSSLPAPNETGPATTAPTTAPTTARPSTVGALRQLAGQGGSVRARCENGRPRVISSVPNQGFQPETDDNGTEIQFRSSTHRTEIKVSCSGLTVQGSVEEHSEDGGGGGGDDHGGGRGNSGRGGGDG